MTSMIRVHAVHAVREDHVDEFREMAAAMVEKVRVDEPGYLGYEAFLSDDERRATSRVGRAAAARGAIRGGDRRALDRLHPMRSREPG